MDEQGAQPARQAIPLVDDLSRPGVELRETHISWVFLSGGYAWKIKKPVDLGFLDFSTPEKRRRACDAEVRLNRRLAPRVYRGVEPVTLDAAGRHRIGGEGPAVDWAVRMIRLPDDARADRLLAREMLSGSDLDHIAAHLAEFHARARCDEETSRYGTVEMISANFEENFEQTRDSLGDYLSPTEAEKVSSWQRRFLTERRELLGARLAAGRVRDGHGDLRLDHIYLVEGGVTVIDCIEFNRRFRFADVCADVAFLAMDLTWQGRADLAERFLATYAREANDYDLYPLVDFYQGYRAFVRGKIAAMLAGAETTPVDAVRRSAAEARRYFLLALASERRPLVPPVMVAIGGLIGAGKSTLGLRLAAEIGAPVVDADRTRKHLLGAGAYHKVHVPPFEDAYTPELTARVYAEVLRRAGCVLDSGRPVVLDASFRAAADRAAARDLAASRGVPFHFVEVWAPHGVCRERLRERARGASVSDGRLEIFDEFAASWQPVEELPQNEYSIVDTTKPIGANVRALRRRLATWPPGFTA